MTSKKTRPIGKNMRNVPVTLSPDEVLGLERLSQISGLGRSPFLRTLVQWAIEHEVILRPRAEEYAAFIEAIKAGASPLPRYRFEPVITEGEVLLIAGVKTKLSPKPDRNAETEQAARERGLKAS